MPRALPQLPLATTAHRSPLTGMSGRERKRDDYNGGKSDDASARKKTAAVGAKQKAAREHHNRGVL